MSALLVIFVSVAVVLGIRCIYIQGFDLAGDASEALMPVTRKIPATRGTITDRNGQVLAESVPAVTLTADPTIIATNGLVPEAMSLADQLKAQAGPGLIAGILSTHLDGDFQTYYDLLATTHTDDGQEIRYAVLARHILTYSNLALDEKLSDLGYVGFFREQAPVRNYPNGTLAANVLGHMTFSDQLEAEGQYPWTGGEGLELGLNAQLSGIDGEEIFETSPYGRIPMGTSILTEPQEGYSYELTLDLGLQYMQDQVLAEAVKKSKAKRGMAVTMTVQGEILALSSYPTYDPNFITEADQDNLGIPVVRMSYEPGSVQKVLTMAALVDQGIVTPETRVVVPGEIKSGDSVINDAWKHDTLHLTATGVLVRSSNIGTITLARQLPKEDLVAYFEGFGLGSSTELGIPGEEPGYLPDASMTGQTRDNIVFGQGLSVTAVQEAAAIAAIGNGGVYVSPHIIRSATTSDGAKVEVPTSDVRRVISQEASQQVLAMMEMTDQSHTAYIDVQGYRVASKSGTAQKIDPKCGCYRLNVMSYVGVAPVEDPYLVTYVVLDEPPGGTGAALAAPAVQDIMQVALPRYAVPPSTTKPPDLPISW
jgi:cell division protein FtsI (penicillin-binding protein 3)